MGVKGIRTATPILELLNPEPGGPNVKRLSIAAISIAMALSLSAIGAQGEEKVIELKDGGKIVVQQDGNTLHTDAAGKRVPMKDGVVMEGKDGEKYVMKNKVLQKHVTEKRGGMAPR